MICVYNAKAKLIDAVKFTITSCNLLHKLPDLFLIGKQMYIFMLSMITSLAKILLLCVSLIPFVFITKAQHYTAPTPSITVKLDHLGIENGLSQGFVATVLQDSRGFLWIGTKDGLNRFDGYAFKVYRHDLFDSSSIAENEIVNITEDDNGRLWIIFRNKGFDIFDMFTEQFTHFTHSIRDTASISSNEVYQIFNTGIMTTM